jgi:dihydrofolate synthase / folylpolyglutamate synthase
MKCPTVGRSGCIVSDILAEWLDWRGEKDFSLERISKVLTVLGEPHLRQSCLHVAGTNGKGSVATMLSALLGARGAKVCLTTSPHLQSVHERVVVDGSSLSDATLRGYALPVKEAELQCKVRLSLHEAMTIIAFLVGMECDYTVLEVGLGGRLDSTNVIKKPLVSIITSIGLDHSDVLGDTLPQIAYEKAGIIKKGVPVVVGYVTEEVSTTLSAAAKSHGSPYYEYGKSFFAHESSFVASDSSTYPFMIPLALHGAHQIQNAAVAVQALHILGLLPQTYLEVLSTGVKWPGRLERVLLDGNIPLIMDGAHNIEGISALKASIRNEPRPRIGIFGCMDTKPWKEMLTEMAQELDYLILIPPPSSRALSCATVAPFLRDRNVPFKALTSIHEALDFVRGVYPDARPVLILFGSLYLIGNARNTLSLQFPRLWERKALPCQTEK